MKSKIEKLIDELGVELCDASEIEEIKTEQEEGEQYYE